MNISKSLRYILRCLLCAGALLTTAPARALVPEYTIENGAVHLKGVGLDNPILYDNDWWFDVFDNNYLWAQASLGHANLRGNIVSRDMWDWQKGYQYKMDACVKDAGKALKLARDSGLKNIPDLTPGADRVLVRPASGRIEDTEPHPNDGSRLIVTEARKASPDKPLLIMAGGPLTTVANAVLTNPEIASNIVVFNLTVSSYGYNGKDGWSACIVAKQTRYVDWGGGKFWDKNSVFTAKHFEALPKNPFCDDMRRLIKSNLGQANQLGDGAALVWLFDAKCWTGAEMRHAEFRGKAVEFTPVQPDQTGDVLIIPKSVTDLRESREEFFRVLNNPALFARAGSGSPDAKNLARPSDAALAPPTGRVEMVLDADMFNEVDDQFALAFALRSPERIDLMAVFAAPFLNHRSKSAGDGMEKSYQETLRLLKLLGAARDEFAFRGSDKFLPDRKTPVDSAAARHLIKLAHKPREKPLYVVGLGAATTLASALLLDPTIKDRLVFVWIGGQPHAWKSARDFNLKQDIAAAQVLFDSGVPLVHIPANEVADQLKVTLPELEAGLKDKSPIADALYRNVDGYYTETGADKRAPRSGPGAWQTIIWDIATIAWLLEPETMVRSKIVPSPVLTDAGDWTRGEDRHSVRVATNLDRSRIFTDLFKKLAR